jgi:hypothetical protein
MRLWPAPDDSAPGPLSFFLSWAIPLVLSARKNPALRAADCPRRGEDRLLNPAAFAPSPFFVPMSATFTAERVRDHFKSTQSKGCPLFAEGTRNQLGQSGDVAMLVAVNDMTFLCCMYHQWHGLTRR